MLHQNSIQVNKVSLKFIYVKKYDGDKYKFHNQKINTNHNILFYCFS